MLHSDDCMPLDEEHDRKKAVEILHSGGIIAYPTETVYGLGCDPFNEEAFLRLKTLKGREGGKPMLLIASSIHQVRQVAKSFEGLAAVLAERFWPGPLTMILQPSETAPPYLRGPGGGIAIRITSDRNASAIASGFGHPVVSTSANLAGEPTAVTISAVRALFGDAVDCYIGTDTPLQGLPSTILDVTADSVKVIREGAIPLNLLESVI